MTWRAITLLLFVSMAIAQTDTVPANLSPSPSMTFDVASVRPAEIKPQPGQWVYVDEGWFEPINSSHLTMTNWSLHNLLEHAFSVLPN
jgi:hypothetical protein